MQLLAIGETDQISAAGHWGGAPDGIDADNGAPTESHKLRRIKPKFNVFESVGDRVAFLRIQRQVQ